MEIQCFLDHLGKFSEVGQSPENSARGSKPPPRAARLEWRAPI